MIVNSVQTNLVKIRIVLGPSPQLRGNIQTNCSVYSYFSSCSSQLYRGAVLDALAAIAKNPNAVFAVFTTKQCFFRIAWGNMTVFCHKYALGRVNF